MKDDPADKIYYLESGKVRAYLLYPDGTERTLCFVERGNLVGEEMAATPPVRIVCVDAVTNLVMYSMTVSQVLEWCSRDQRTIQELMALYMRKIELLSSWIFYAQFQQNSAKLTCFLYSKTADHCEVYYTQEQIASVTGMSRVSVSNCLRNFAAQGLLRQEYRCIHVLDRPALRSHFGEKEFH